MFSPTAIGPAIVNLVIVAMTPIHASETCFIAHHFNHDDVMHACFWTHRKGNVKNEPAELCDECEFFMEAFVWLVFPLHLVFKTFRTSVISLNNIISLNSISDSIPNTWTHVLGNLTKNSDG